MSGKDKPKSAPDVPGATKAVRKLGDELAEARQLHRLLVDPLLNTVRAERLRVSVTRSLWFFLACGLGFTTAGVQAFLADGYTTADPQWWAAWLVEPAFAGILITLLRWEAEMLARRLEVTAAVVRKLKRLLLFSTLVMNVIPTVRPPDGHSFNLGNLFVHIVIPLIVFFLAEVMPVVQEMCTRAKDTATVPAAPDVDLDQQTDEPPADIVRPAVAPVVPSVKLPPTVMTQVRTTLDSVRSEGRTPNVADIAKVVALPDNLARQLLADLTPVNGHTVPNI
ncbi:hypothetical protein ACFQ1S_09670 [Kibdelosporangium lantanae]|uniref:DUF2637 domain-containing protein n=1 Tax=Kibdelosporangium lantanae TaxID=1497396 RepID=A0ABW3M727_9PSEU